jgi:hypothetical protein
MYASTTWMFWGLLEKRLVTDPEISRVIGAIPYRIALAGGWIDQPFISRLNPKPPGSMVVVSLQPSFRLMERCGMGTSTRKVATGLWPDGIPSGDPQELVRVLYKAENENKVEPSGSQDMAGLIYPGISRLDYDFGESEGTFPNRVESCLDADVFRWFESVMYVLAVSPRPDGYTPLGFKNLDPIWIERLGRSGRDCFLAIVQRDILKFGESMNECMRCWESILPNTVQHPRIQINLKGLLNYYQQRYPGAMYSGCGGGYLFVVSDEPVPGGFKVSIRF